MDLVSNSSDILTSIATNQIVLGPWCITFTNLRLQKYVPAVKGVKKEPCLKFIGDILDGSFNYNITWPVCLKESNITEINCDFVLLADIIKHLESTLGGSISNSVYDYEVGDVSNINTDLAVKSIKALSVDMKNMDLRLRDGLPHLVPINDKVHECSQSYTDIGGMVHLAIEMKFRYIGSTVHNSH